jgi:hypothetical protein
VLPLPFHLQVSLCRPVLPMLAHRVLLRERGTSGGITGDMGGAGATRDTVGIAVGGNFLACHGLPGRAVADGPTGRGRIAQEAAPSGSPMRSAIARYRIGSGCGFGSALMQL